VGVKDRGASSLGCQGVKLPIVEVKRVFYEAEDMGRRRTTIGEHIPVLAAGGGGEWQGDLVYKVCEGKDFGLKFQLPRIL
jgi:hypothetical protein